MRRTKLRVLLAAIPILAGASCVAWGDGPPSIYSDPAYTARGDDSSSQQSIYEKVQIGQPLDRHENPTQADFDAAKKKFDDAVAALNKARADAVDRLEQDPQIVPLEQKLGEAKNKYDDEIDNALWVMSYYDEYQDLINTADQSQQQLESVTKNSPNDTQAISAAQKRFDDARNAVEDYEDTTLDNDKYVQDARRTFLAARDARDHAMDTAIANDLAVKSARRRRTSRSSSWMRWPRR